MPTPDQDALGWLRKFETACRGRDFEAGRLMFAQDAVAFGTWAMAVHPMDGHGPGAEGDRVLREHQAAGLEVSTAACRLELPQPAERVLIKCGHGQDYALSCAHGKADRGHASHAGPGARPGAVRRGAGLAALARRGGAERARVHPRHPARDRAVLAVPHFLNEERISVSELCWTSMTELARMIASKKVSPVEVVQAHLDRIAT